MVWPFQKKVTINLSGDSAASCLEKWKHVTGTQTFFRSIMCGNPKLEKLGRKWRLIIKEHEGSYQIMKILWNQVIVMVTQLNKFTKMHCSVQSLSHVQLFATYELQHTRPPTPSPTPRVYPNSCPSNRWCHPTISSSVIPFSSCPQSFPASGSYESGLRIRWPKYWSFSFNITPSNEHLGLISFRMDWLDLLAVQGTLKSLLQHHSLKATILPCSAFFIVQLSHPYNWKNHSLD